VLATRLNRLLCLSLNHLIKQESWAITRLRPFSGAHISIIGLPLTITLAIDQYGFFSSSQLSDHPDVTLTLPADALGRGLLSPEQLASSVKISGPF
jgi:ubiquinone biosynthesis protein UbiJ